jgi:superfamily I DNA and/or RNA helicase
MPEHFSAHFSRLQSLLKVEREEDRRQYQEKIQNRSVKDRVKEGVCWYPLHIRKSYLGLGEKWVVEVERSKNQGQRHFFQPGASAGLFFASKNNTLTASGIVSRVLEDRLTLMLNRDDPPEWLSEDAIGLDLLFDESTYDEMDRTLNKLKQSEKGRITELVSIFLGKSSPRFNPTQEIKFPHLNDSQNQALNLVSSAQDVALVHGPPGTGKTTTLVQTIVETINTEKQVLVCAPSNAAVDLLVEKLHQQQVSVLRLGHPARVTEEVISHTLDAQLATHDDAKMLKDLRKRSEEMRRQGKKYKRKYGGKEAQQRKLLLREARNLKDEAMMLENHMIQDLLNNAQVIACTLVGANSNYLLNRTFKSAFIDESSQALEPACWIPILRAQRVIMAGDHLQLPPTVKSRYAEKEGLGVTLFERCMNQHDADEMLRIQYRMHPHIMAFSNQRFYQGELQTADLVTLRKQYFREPAVFIDTAGCGFEEQINPETLSTYNVEEANFLWDHLEKLLLEQEELSQLYVGVIAPYKAQIETLRRQLNTKGWDQQRLKQLTINTVDGFQGQERDVIYISLTRSNSQGEIGFLADQRRLNVAMTRARQKLIMIGDSSTLSNHSFFDEMISYFQGKGAYHSAFEYIYDP